MAVTITALYFATAPPMLSLVMVAGAIYEVGMVFRTIRFFGFFAHNLPLNTLKDTFKVDNTSLNPRVRGEAA